MKTACVIGELMRSKHFNEARQRRLECRLPVYSPEHSLLAIKLGQMEHICDGIGDNPGVIESFTFQLIQSLSQSPDLTCFEMSLSILNKAALMYHQVKALLCQDIFWETISEVMTRNPSTIDTLTYNIGLFIELMENPSFIVTINNLRCSILLAARILKSDFDRSSSHNLHNLLVFLFNVLEKAGKGGFRKFNALLSFPKLLNRVRAIKNFDVWMDCLDFMCFCVIDTPEYFDLLDFGTLDELIAFLIDGLSSSSIEVVDQIKIFRLVNGMIARGSSIPYRLFYTELGHSFIERTISTIAYEYDCTLSYEAAQTILNCMPKFPLDCSMVLQKSGAMFIFLDSLDEVAMQPHWKDVVIAILELILLMCECELSEESRESLLGEESIALLERLESSDTKCIRNYSSAINKFIEQNLFDN